MNWLFRNLHQSWMLVGLCLGIIFGTILSIILRWNFFSSPIWILFVVILFAFAFVKPNRLFFILILIVGMILAFFRTSADLAGEDFVKQFVGKTTTISGTISEDPDEDEGKTTIKLSNLKINDVETKGAIFVQLGGTSEMQRSDVVTLSGKVSEGFGSFSGAMYRPKIESISRPEPGDVFLSMRNWFAEKISRNIPEEESSLGLAYLLGMKNGLNNEVLEMLRVIGLTHIVVASGTHLGIIVGATRRIFGKISRFAGFITAILLILVFGGIIGWTASITRAAIVTVLSILAWYVGRKFEAWRILLIAMAVTLLINPMFITNLGWLLSFGSFGGILLLSPVILEFFFGEKKPNKFTEIIVATISAQLLCIPILIYFFGTISLISVVANLLILPTIPFAMGLTFFTGVFDFIPLIGTIFGKVTTILLDYHLVLMNFFAEQKMFLIEIPAENPLFFLLYIPIILPFIIFWIRNKKKKFPDLQELFF